MEHRKRLSHDELEAEATARLAVPKSPAALATVARLCRDFKLSDSDELGLKLLAPADLRKLLDGEASLRAQLRQATDASATVQRAIWKLDANVGVLLQQLLQSQEPSQAPPMKSTSSRSAKRPRQDLTLEWPESKEQLWMKANARLEQHSSSPQALRTLSALCRDFELGDEVELALRMLSPASVTEFIAALTDVRRKLFEVDDGPAVIMGLISDLEPEVSDLMARLREVESELDQSGDSAVTKASSKSSETAAKKSRV